MTEQILITLENLKHPKVKIINKPIKKQTQLFEIENQSDIQFNGYNSILEYQAFLDTAYQNCKAVLQAKMMNASSQRNLIKQNLDLGLFEIKMFRKRYFPKTNPELLFSRIELLKSSVLNERHDELLKKR